MKVYGFDCTGPHRGELMAAQIDALELEFGMEAIAAGLDWEFAATSFKAAKAELLQEMVLQDADPDLVRLARQCKARDVPEV